MISLDHPIAPDWKWGTSEGSREFDRLTDRRLSCREILEWLEEAETLSLHLQAMREKAGCRPDKATPPSINGGFSTERLRAKD